MVSLRSDRRPLYVQASAVVQDFIVSEGLQPGDKLPPETELAKILGASRNTVREGLRWLAFEGQIERIHGRGTIVAQPASIVAGLTNLESLEALARKQGWVCTTGQIVINGDSPEPSVTSALSIPSGVRVTYLSRVKYCGGVPVARCESWIPVDLITQAELRAEFQTSITELLFHSSELNLDYARASVSAAACTSVEARQLERAEGEPLAVLLETFYEKPATPLCYSRNVFVPGAVALEVARRPPI